MCWTSRVLVRGGLRPDPYEQDVYWTTHEAGDGAGIYKMWINRAARSWDLETGWADNGVAPPADPGIQIRQMEAWEAFLVADPSTVGPMIPSQTTFMIIIARLQVGSPT